MPQSRQDVTAANQATGVLHDEKVKLVGPKHGLNFLKLRPIQSLALALSRNDAILDRPLVKLDDKILHVVCLVIQAKLLLVLTAADSSLNSDDQSVAVARFEVPATVTVL